VCRRSVPARRTQDRLQGVPGEAAPLESRSGGHLVNVFCPDWRPYYRGPPARLASSKAWADLVCSDIRGITLMQLTHHIHEATDADEGVPLRSLSPLQAAASVFKYLKEVVVPQLTCMLPSDFTPDGLNMIENIMCAQVRPRIVLALAGIGLVIILTAFRWVSNVQSQACFYEKAVIDRRATGMKSSVIARLAAQVLSV
jgi:hypothetical protein